MTIEEKRKEIKEILLVNGGIEHLTMLLDERLIFSSSHLPNQVQPVEWGVKNLNNTMLVVYFDETIRCYLIIMFKINGITNDKCQFKTEIIEISELYFFSSGPTLIRILENESDTPLNIGYSRSKATECDLFAIELDLERLTREFPRMVERIADAIVFLGEVLFAGEYS